MIKSKYFWIGAILVSFVPLLLIDITVHSLDWKKDVREEIISLVHNATAFDKGQKTEALDMLFERMQLLSISIYLKGIASLLLLALSIYFFKKYRKQQISNAWKPVLFTSSIICCFLLVKIFLVTQLSPNDKIKFLSIPTDEYSFQQLYQQNFKGKVVYVDFWGTTCGPCLQEFRNFTKPLKEKYKANKDIAYLYVSQGNQFLWKKQIQKYNVEGHHVFIGEDQYSKLYQHSIQDSGSLIIMPRYLIIDKSGKIVVTDAKRPSEKDSLYLQLDKYLAQN